MLHKPEVNTVAIMELADFIDDLKPGRFSMATYGRWEEPRCICGWLLHNNGVADKDNEPLAADMLGIDLNMAHRLFTCPFFGAHEAATALRRLAVTGVSIMDVQIAFFFLAFALGFVLAMVM